MILRKGPKSLYFIPAARQRINSISNSNNICCMLIYFGHMLSIQSFALNFIQM